MKLVSTIEICDKFCSNLAEKLEDKTTITVSSFNLILILCTKLSIIIFDLMIKNMYTFNVLHLQIYCASLLVEWGRPIGEGHLFPQKETSDVIVAVSELFTDYMKAYKLQ